MNLPIYRAKKIDSDEWIIGWLVRNKILVDIDENLACPFEIDPTTLAIHFPDMIDIKGDKIFASLSKDGKGGDICYVRDFSYGDLQGVARYEDNCFRVHRKGKAMGISLKCRDIKVIGIQE